MSIITHLDYLIEKRAIYLRSITECYEIWAALPGEVDSWWRSRSEMKLIRENNEWETLGLEKERARLAYAVLEGDKLLYEIAEAPCRG